jgi:hypothetical protein
MAQGVAYSLDCKDCCGNDRIISKSHDIERNVAFKKGRAQWYFFWANHLEFHYFLLIFLNNRVISSQAGEGAMR